MVDTVLVLVSVGCYSQQIAPAATEFAKSGKTDGIISLVRQGQKRMRRLPIDQYRSALGDENYDPMQDALDILEGREFYGPSTNHVPPRVGARTSKTDIKSYIDGQVYPLLFETLCVDYNSGVRAQQVLTQGRLLPYLYEHSTPLEHAFTGGLRGKPLPLFSYMELLSSADVASVLRELELVPIPDDSVEKRKAQAKLDALGKQGGVFVSSQFADAFGPSPSLALSELRKLLKASLADSKLAIVQRFE